MGSNQPDGSTLSPPQIAPQWSGMDNVPDLVAPPYNSNTAPLYTGDVRSASIVAVSDSAIYVLREPALARLRAENPDLAGRFDQMVIRKLSGALTRTNKLVATFR